MKRDSSPGSSVTGNSPQNGSSLIEALLALVILGFGLLAIGKFQITLADAIGTGRDRVEATFLAQEELDRLRAFDLLEVLEDSPAYSFGYDEIVAASSASLDDSNYVASFSRGVRVPNNPVNLTWSGTAVTHDLKLVLVDLTWTNKQGATQSLTLPSVIAKHDPADAAWLIACQTDDAIRCGTKDIIKTPYNRDLRIPYPAKDLGGGKSVFSPPGAGYIRLVFNNSTGIIESRCTDSDTDIQNDVIAGYTGCTTLNGYLLSGYISAATSPRTPPDFIDINGAPNKEIGDQTSISAAPNITQGTLVECFDDSALPNTPDPTPDPRDPTKKLIRDFISYICVITPVDDGDPDTPPVWSGTLTVNFTGTGVTVGTGASDVKVCRFGVAGTSDGSIESNRAHPSTYLTVTASLENQNFIVIQGNKNCNEDHEIQHQP